MAVGLIPVGPGLPEGVAAILKSHEQAIRGLQNPGAPVQLARVDTKANLAAKSPPASYPNAAIICDEINAVCISTNVAGTYTWLRADGSAL